MKRGLVLIAALLLGACAGGPRPLPEAGDRTRQALERLESWHLEGRIAVRHDGQGGQGLLYWDQADASDFTLRLLDALGRQQLIIRGRAGRVMLQTRDGARQEADSTEALMQQTLGWSVPLSPLRWWIRGLPAPRDAGGEILQAEPGSSGIPYTMLRQDGWEIRYLRHQWVDGLPLPALLELRHDTLRLRLVIEAWSPKST